MEVNFSEISDQDDIVYESAISCFDIQIKTSFDPGYNNLDYSESPPSTTSEKVKVCYVDECVSGGWTVDQSKIGEN